MVKVIFCAHCQADTPHTVEQVGSELIASCHCGLFWKFPITTDSSVYTKMIAEIAKNNTGRVLAVEPEVAKDALDAFIHA